MALLRKHWRQIVALVLLLALGAIVLRTDDDESAAVELVDRLGGQVEMDARGRIAEICFFGRSPDLADLEIIAELRHLRKIDLSATTAGDRELLALAPSGAELILVPAGRTSQAAREVVGESRVGIGLGLLRRIEGKKAAKQPPCSSPR